MYIGPWQEFRLAKAVGDHGNARPSHDLHKRRLPSERLVSAGLSTASVASNGSFDSFRSFQDNTQGLESVNGDDIERLVASLQSAGKCRKGEDATEKQREVLETFMRMHGASMERRDSVSSSSGFSTSSFQGKPLIDLDPQKTKRDEERFKERRLVQIRRDRIPLKLSQLQKKRQDFMEHINNQNNHNGERQVIHRQEEKHEEENHHGEDQTTVSILPARPSLLFDSFIPKTSGNGTVAAILPSNFGGPGKAPNSIVPNQETIPQCLADSMPVILSDTELKPSESEARSAKQAPAPTIGFEELNIPHLDSTGLAGLPSNMIDDEVDDLLNWSRKLGLEGDDTFLFEDDEQF